MMTNHVETLYMQETSQVHAISDDIFKQASQFHATTLKTLTDLETHLECCSVQHVLIPRRRWSLVAKTILVALIAVCVVALVAFLNPKRRVRHKPVVR
jgi:hypothetical protein